MVFIVSTFLIFGGSAVIMALVKNSSSNKVQENFKIEDGNKIVYYKDGRGTEIDKRVEIWEPILELSEKLFAEADSTYKLFVTKQLITGVKERKAIEIIYSEPKKLTTRNTKQVNVSRLLIPLSGEFAKNRATIFYGTPNYDESNVVINSTGRDLLKLIEEKISRTFLN